ncbi:MAG: hypothetical protein EKK41_14775 [Hyphomicrobiales bacterium]|nr:MAG: hypothetical protein EKK41_14775 [Hyphomicrobiales bacterium]
MFIETSDAKWIAARDIISIEPSTKGCTIKTSNGKHHSPWEAHVVAEALAPIVPAQSGFHLLEVVTDHQDDKPLRFEKFPVVAWRVTTHGARPISSLPLQHDQGELTYYYLEHPTGRITQGMEIDWADREELLHFLLDQWRKKRAQS